MANKKIPIGPVNPAQLARCLNPLLKALQWRGNRRMLFESMPHFFPIASVEDFCSTMENLGYDNHVSTTKLNIIDPVLIPCLFIPEEGGAPKIIVRVEATGLLAFDSETEKTELILPDHQEGQIVAFQKSEAVQDAAEGMHWFKRALDPKRKSLYYVGFLTFLQVILMLASPLFIISIYDKVVTTGSIQMLVSFLMGAALALTALFVIMMIRSRLISYLGSFVQRRVGDAIFKQLLELPAAYTESATTGTQITRLSDFNSVREFFSSPLLGTLIEVPFLLIYLVVIWIIGDWLVLVPIVFSGIFALTAYILWHIAQRGIRESASLQSKRQEFLVESIQRMHSLQLADIQNKWQTRFRRMNGQLSLFNQRVAFLSNANEYIFDVLTIVAGLATLAVGVFLVSEKTIQIGALIGVMFIVWRVLSPLKVVCVSAQKLTQLKRSVAQIDNLMRIPKEQQSKFSRKNAPINIMGAVTFSQVTFRYPGSDSSALSGINFTVQPGQVLAVIGQSSAGKSTLAKLILGLYLPQIGHVFIDGRDIQQYDFALLRTQIAYVPQKAELFYGTVAQNLRLADPTASDERLVQAATDANLLKDILALKDGFNTRVKDYGDKRMAASFCQKLSLARAYLRNASILIMDEPVTSLDSGSDKAMTELIMRAKGKQTVILITHRPSQVRLADMAVVLYEGRQVLMGKPDEVMEKMPKDLI